MNILLDKYVVGCSCPYRVIMKMVRPIIKSRPPYLLPNERVPDYEMREVTNQYIKTTKPLHIHYTRKGKGTLNLIKENRYRSSTPIEYRTMSLIKRTRRKSTIDLLCLILFHSSFLPFLWKVIPFLRPGWQRLMLLVPRLSVKRGKLL